MIHTIKRINQAITPKPLFWLYHTALTLLAAWRYGFPARKMVVIGVTGTNGKSTTCILIADLLKSAGLNVGLASSVMFRVGDREWLNKSKMTMLGRTQLQSLLADMAKAGCTYAVVEVSSQGLVQNRLAGIDVDMAVFTNLTPEHLESHGGFENYKKAKARLFSSLSRSYRKTISSHEVPKIIIANTDDEHASYYMGFKADRKVGFGVNTLVNHPINNLHIIKNIGLSEKGSSFDLDQYHIQSGLEGLFNVYNAAAAYAVIQELGFPVESLGNALQSVHGLPGRMEWIEGGQDYRVLVDYAPEPASLQALYDYLGKAYKTSKGRRIIHVLGSAGGGRDVARREVLGRMAAQYGDIVIITNEDPYDEDPQAIITQVAAGAINGRKKEGEDLFMIQDRKKAIFTACAMAKTGDIVLLTGKGAEQAIMGPNGTKQVWDERDIAGQAIRETLKH